jgi:transcription-repair coupling factor (superfamily II helicase)
VISGAPEGHDALVLSRLAREAGLPAVLHVAEDEARIARMAESLRFFAPQLDVLTFPAWDCVPYDRVSPNSEAVARRIETLTRLAAEPGPGPLVVVTTVSAALQRVPPRDTFRGAMFGAGVGQRLSLAELTAYLTRNGYVRTETVREPGEFALRGGIADLFPPGSEEPLRLDLFGDAIEHIRSFDPVTQRSDRKLDRVTLMPVSEIMLSEETVASFRSGYRELFGAATRDDLLYEAVSEGRRPAGIEHWLPLFFERLETLFDYLPGAAVTLDPHGDDACEARFETIADYYAARQTAHPGEPPYHPLPPERLYLDRGEWGRSLATRAVGALTPFAAPEHAEHTIDAGGRGGRDFADVRAQPGANAFDAVRDTIAGELRGGRRTVIACYSEGSRERIAGLLRDHGIAETVPCESWHQVTHLPAAATALVVLPLEHGWSGAHALVLTEQDILGDRLARPSRKRRRAEAFIAEASNLAEGDFVVHVEHGIGRYEGLATIEVDRAPHDCLKLVYQGGDKLFVPVENIEVLSRYGSEQSGAELDKLGGAGWQARKARVRKRIRDIADQLLKVAAARTVHEAPVLAPPEGLYDEFCARFPFAETEDQITAIGETTADLAAGRPMDRLVCGDVGFGKTEVALRAAFIAVMNGVQVAVVTPTTLLSRQHVQTFRRRFEGLPVKVEQLSRLTTAAEAAKIKRGLKEGSVDIVIGTHALLAKDIAFRNLGLLIVDEEQHFGVVQKERLKQLRANVHVLTLTATPIPRTLQMALTGVGEIQSPPPVDRLAVRPS